jgi:hypothetical protein
MQRQRDGRVPMLRLQNGKNSGAEMTPAITESHYEITEEHIEEIERLFSLPEDNYDEEDYESEKKLVVEIRSHPLHKNTSVEDITQEAAAIVRVAKKEERERVLDKVIGIIEKIYFRWDCYEPNVDKEEAACSALSESMAEIKHMYMEEEKL